MRLSVKLLLLITPILEVAGVLLLSGTITLQQLAGSHYAPVILAHGISPVIFGVILMLSGFGALFAGFFLQLSVTLAEFKGTINPFEAAKTKKPKTLRQKIMLSLRIILILSGIITIVSYVYGAPAEVSLPIGGSMVGGVLLEKVGRAIAEGFSVFRNVQSLQNH